MINMNSIISIICKVWFCLDKKSFAKTNTHIDVFLLVKMIGFARTPLIFCTFQIDGLAIHSFFKNGLGLKQISNPFLRLFYS